MTRTDVERLERYMHKKKRMSINALANGLRWKYARAYHALSRLIKLQLVHMEVDGAKSFYKYDGDGYSEQP